MPDLWECGVNSTACAYEAPCIRHQRDTAISQRNELLEQLHYIDFAIGEGGEDEDVVELSITGEAVRQIRAAIAKVAG